MLRTQVVLSGQQVVRFGAEVNAGGVPFRAGDMRHAFRNSINPRRNRPSDRKTGPAAAGTGGVRVIDRKPRPDQLFAEVNRRVGQERQGNAVHHHFLPPPLQHQIILGRLIQPDVILEPGTPAALDRHAQGLAAPRVTIDFGQPRKGPVGHFWRQRDHHPVLIPIIPLPFARFNPQAADIYDRRNHTTTGCRMQQTYASDPCQSRGRLYSEDESAFRSCFQRDRDRIIHASAFRRLKHKTQVFVEHEGDYFRTRLTHSIEVAQVARTIAGALGLNPELAEAVALAHDLGHPPFGHTGEEALNALMAPYGGFDHNAQAIRVVTGLERHYAEWDGLNLTWETLEGIAKHNGPVAGAPPYALADYNARHDLELDTHAGAEAQVAALSDDIAYNNHDLHDGLRAELFSTEELAGLPILGGCFDAVDARYPGLSPYRRQHEALRRFFGRLVEDAIAVSRAGLAALSPRSVADIRHAPAPVVRFSDPVRADLRVIRGFLFERMYRAPRVVEMRRQVTVVVNDLFPLFMARPALLPGPWRRDMAGAADQTALARVVADYIAGMTDRFAFQMHKKLVSPDSGDGAGANGATPDIDPGPPHDKPRPDRTAP